MNENGFLRIDINTSDINNVLQTPENFNIQDNSNGLSNLSKLIDNLGAPEDLNVDLRNNKDTYLVINALAFAVMTSDTEQGLEGYDTFHEFVWHPNGYDMNVLLGQLSNNTDIDKITERMHQYLTSEDYLPNQAWNADQIETNKEHMARILWQVGRSLDQKIWDFDEKKHVQIIMNKVDGAFMQIESVLKDESSINQVGEALSNTYWAEVLKNLMEDNNLNSFEKNKAIKYVNYLSLNKKTRLENYVIDVGQPDLVITERLLETIEKELDKKANFAFNKANLISRLDQISSEKEYKKEEMDSEINKAYTEFITNILSPIGQMFTAMKYQDPKFADLDPKRIAFPIEGLQTLAKAKNIDLWSEYFLTKFSEKYLGLIENSLVEISDLKHTGEQKEDEPIFEIFVNDWIGPQGVGKGTIQKTLTKLGKWSLSDENTLSDDLKAITREFASESRDLIETGTGENGGIFNPAWRIKAGQADRANPKYLAYQALGQAAGIPVSQGRLLNDPTMNLLAVIELGRAVLLKGGENNQITIDCDVWPRTSGQDTYLRGLSERLAKKNVKISPSILQIEAVDEEVAKLIEEHGEIATQVHGVLTNEWAKVSTDAKAYMGNGIVDVYEHLKIDLTTQEGMHMREEKMNLIKDVGSKMITDFANEFRNRMLQDDSINKFMSNIKEEEREIALKIYEGLVEGRAGSLSNMGDRFKQSLRDDEAKIASIATRCRSYDRDSATAARQMKLKVVPGKGEPKKAIEGMVKALVIEKYPNYDLESDNFIKLLQKAQELHLETVEGNKKAA